MPATGATPLRGLAVLLVMVCAPRPAVGQCPDGTPAPCRAVAVAVRSPAPDANSVAVLPFENTRRDTAYDYLSDGLASSIATTLAQVPRLAVRSPSFVRRVSQSGVQDEATLGRRLDVRYIVEGEFQRGGDRVRVAVRLVALPSGTERWGDAYTRPNADLLGVQEDIAREVATRIAGALLPPEASAIAARPTRNPAAYDLVLRGNFYLTQRSPAAVRRAIDEYEAAARLDSTYADPLARVAYAYGLVLAYDWDFGLTRDSVLARGVADAERAVRLDSASSDAWMARGLLLTKAEPLTFRGVIPSLERAVRLDPRNVEAWHALGTQLQYMGRSAASDSALRRAVALEPDRFVTLDNLGVGAELAGRLDEARRWCDSALAINPGWVYGLNERTRIAIAQHDTATARTAVAAMDAMTAPEAVPTAMAAGAAYDAWRGDSAGARARAERAVAAYGGDPHRLWLGVPAALALAEAGEVDRSLDLLERFQPRGVQMHLWLRNRGFDPLRANPRFVRLFAETAPPAEPE
jgi:TolB-like protein/Tfp pilus assembly protein PilF